MDIDSWTCVTLPFIILSNVLYLQELHTTEKTKLITQLRDAKNLIEQLEQDKVSEEFFRLKSHLD